MKVWTEGAAASLRDCFGSTVWEIFSQGAYWEEYTSTVLDDMHFCTEVILDIKPIKVIPNQKPQYQCEVPAQDKGCFSHASDFRRDVLAYMKGKKASERPGGAATHSE